MTEDVAGRPSPWNLKWLRPDVVACAPGWLADAGPIRDWIGTYSPPGGGGPAGRAVRHAALPATTRVTFNSHVACWFDWAVTHDVPGWPADPADVAAWLRWWGLDVPALEAAVAVLPVGSDGEVDLRRLSRDQLATLRTAGEVRPSTLRGRATALDRFHKERGLTPPGDAYVVRATLDGIERLVGGPPRKAAALRADDMAAALDSMLEPTADEARDVAAVRLLAVYGDRLADADLARATLGSTAAGPAGLVLPGRGGPILVAADDGPDGELVRALLALHPVPEPSAPLMPRSPGPGRPAVYTPRELGRLRIRVRRLLAQGALSRGILPGDADTADPWIVDAAAALAARRMGKVRAATHLVFARAAGGLRVETAAAATWEHADDRGPYVPRSKESRRPHTTGVHEEPEAPDRARDGLREMRERTAYSCGLLRAADVPETAPVLPALDRAGNVLVREGQPVRVTGEALDRAQRAVLAAAGLGPVAGPDGREQVRSSHGVRRGLIHDLLDAGVPLRDIARMTHQSVGVVVRHYS